MKKFLAFLLISLFAITGALCLLNTFGSTEFQAEALTARLKLDMKNPGITEIQVPPIGKVKAITHKSPLGIVITLESVDLNKLKTIIAQSPKTSELLDDVHQDVVQKFKSLIYKALFLGAAGGILGLLLLQRRRWYEYVYGAAVGLITVSLLLTMTYRSYDINSFKTPKYEGMLKSAPWMIGLVQNSITKFDLWGKQLQAVADNLYDMFQRVDSLEAMGPTGNGDMKVLHVSDLHNNPAALDFIEQVAATFKVDFIIDTGDISDFGSPLESVFAERVKKLKVPYVFIPGNHETKDIIDGMKRIPNVRVIEGSNTTVDGVKIAGIADPAAYSMSVEPPDDKTVNQWSAKLEQIISKMPAGPDILAVHNNRIAGEFAGGVPIILHGHDHSYKINVRQGTVIIDAGTTGAAGIGGLKNNDTPYSMVMLQLKKTDTGYRLIAADTIKVSNLQSGYSLERRMFPELNRVDSNTNRP